MLILIGSFAVLLLLGIPIAYSLGLSSFAYFLIEQPHLLQILPQRMFSGMNNFALISLPLFILMGLVMNLTGITQKLIQFSLAFVGRMRGGLGLVNVFGSMVFGGISGSSTSDTASIGSILIPEMKRRGYPLSFASGITVASSTMGMIIPPSVPIVTYAIVAQESVGRLFMAGLIPGVLIGLFQLIITYAIAVKRDYPKEDLPFTAGYIWSQVKASIPVLVMPLFVVGSVVFGIATATESAAIGVLYALVIGFCFIGFKLIDGFGKALREAIITSAKIMMIVALSQLYIWVLALERIPAELSMLVLSLDLGAVGTMLLMAAIILVIGTVIDVTPAILLLTPVFLPVAEAVGVSGITFGILLVCGLAVGNCTPPVGNCLNVCAAISRQGIGTIFKGALPFLSANFVMLILIALFPFITTWLPSLM